MSAAVSSYQLSITIVSSNCPLIADSFVRVGTASRFHLPYLFPEGRGMVSYSLIERPLLRTAEGSRSISLAMGSRCWRW
jgi:hypothetical protein